MFRLDVEDAQLQPTLKPGTHVQINNLAFSEEGIELARVKVNDYVYLGAWIATAERDLTVRNAKAWAACHKLKKI